MSERMQIREAYGRALAKLGKENERVVVLNADLSKGTFTYFFTKEFPERSFNFGIAEQNMMVAAAGLSTTGKIPFVNTYAVFATMRACEQLRTFVAYPNLNVKIAGGHGGLTTGADGVTHQGIEDIAIVRALPNMVLLVPADPVETELVVRAAAEYVGPVYIRLCRHPLPNFFDEKYRFVIGKAATIRKGDDVTIISTGVMWENALRAAELLKRNGIEARVLNMSTIKPIDERAILRAAKETGAIVTAEDHTIIGGLGGAVAEVLTAYYPVPLERIGIKDVFGESGTPEELFEHYGLTANDIARAARRAIKRKREATKRRKRRISG